jgi:hypothetical protein
MDNQLSSEKLSPKQWWWSKIREFNKGVLVSGLIAFIIYCALGASVVNLIKQYELVLWAVTTFVVLYFIYIILANTLYAFGWLIDSALNDDNSESFRLQLFTGIYWFAVTVPVLVMCGLVYLLTKTLDFLV